MNEEQVIRVVNEMMDRMFGQFEMEEREVERLMQEQNKESEDE